MKKKALFLVLALWMSWIGCYADEGMWIPMLLKKYNIEDMQKEGFKLTAEDIYDINKASLKDAVIGRGPGRAVLFSIFVPVKSSATKDW